MIPPTITHQQKKVTVVGGKPKFYEPQELKEARAKLRAHLSTLAPEQPIEGALRLICKWLFPVTSGHADGEYKTTKPDTDNLTKMLKDVMEELGFYKNDAQVASEIIEKFYAEKTGIYIKLEVIG
jgi:Holliday junction resolvase RusA-like endonuclease